MIEIRRSDEFTVCVRSLKVQNARAKILYALTKYEADTLATQ